MQGYSGSDELHEECGVFGILSPEGAQAAEDIWHGLIALQHRGQESAGMSVSETDGAKGNVLTKKGMGLVGEVFGAARLREMKGNIGVGHVRYSTTGGSVVENAQPIAMNYIKGCLALVHNGNIMNAADIKREQMLRGQAHYTTSDTEIMAYEIISERLKTDSIESAVMNAVGRCRGGYACIVMSPRKLIGIRDPLGIKPLCLGRRGESLILASESAAVRAVGGEFVRDVAPGEMIVLSAEGIRSRSMPARAHAHCVFEYIYFARSDSVLDGVGVYDARLRAGRALARRGPAEADMVTGVPDSGLAAAQGYALETGLPFVLAFHKNSYVSRSFIKPTDGERTSAVHMKLSVIESAVRGKRIVLIDDSIVRGTTMRRIVDMLRAAGAAQVHVRISSPPFLHPCLYGTDVPDTAQLIASGYSREEICRRIGADSLCYLDIADLNAMTDGLPLCAACFDGRYPV